MYVYVRFRCETVRRIIFKCFLFFLTFDQISSLNRKFENNTKSHLRIVYCKYTHTHTHTHYIIPNVEWSKR